MRQKICAIIMNDGKLLVVRNERKNIFIMPGGGQEDGETHEQCLTRELMEELEVKPKNFRFFGTFVEPAMFEKGNITAHVYFVDIDGEPEPSSEVVECLWLDKDYKKKNIICGSVLEKHVIPKLIDTGMLK